MSTEAGCGAGQCLYGAAPHTGTSRQSLRGRTAISIISTHNIYTISAQIYNIYTVSALYLRDIYSLSRAAAVTAATAPGLRAPPRGRPGDEMRTPRARAEATHHAGTASANILLR